MTQWVEEPEEGRDRGPAAVARAWAEVVTRPHRFFRNGVAPGDQAPGLVFALTVVLVEEFIRVVLARGANPLVGNAVIPAGVGGTTAVLLDLLWIGLAVLIVAPAALHLLAAVATVLLVALAPDRGGVSETVQVIAYATAPCALSGIPVPEVTALCGIYAAYLLHVGTHEVHDTTRMRGIVVEFVPAVVAFGYGFRAFAAIGTVLRRWYVI